VQKVVLARELSSRPRVIIAANPTRGLDVGATEAVRALLIRAASDGVGILLISEDLDEILMLADRIAVVYEGRIVGTVQRSEADVHQLGLMMAGSAA
jgi:simple sugar transport system ATP-binding protein